MLTRKEASMSQGAPLSASQRAADVSALKSVFNDADYTK